MILFSQLETITSGKLISLHRDQPVTTLLTDSRKSNTGEGTVFFAVHGDHHNGHAYVQDLYDKGVRQFVIEERGEFLRSIAEANVIQVASSIAAIQQIAAHHRSLLDLPVIGI